MQRNCTDDGPVTLREATRAKPQTQLRRVTFPSTAPCQMRTIHRGETNEEIEGTVS